MPFIRKVRVLFKTRLLCKTRLIFPRVNGPNIPFRRFLFLVVPFEVVFSQEVFHKTILETFNHTDGCETDIDDFLVWGSTISVLRKC